MKTRVHFALILSVVLLFLLAGVLIYIPSPVEGQKGGAVSGSATVGNGTITATFKVPAGNIKLTLPDDIRAGDTISGTVSVEPAGGTNEEKDKNRKELRNYVLTAPLMPGPYAIVAPPPPNVSINTTIAVNMRQDAGNSAVNSSVGNDAMRVANIADANDNTGLNKPPPNLFRPTVVYPPITVPDADDDPIRIRLLIPTLPTDPRTSNGFYIQDPDPDAGNATSEGIFVFGPPPTPLLPSGVSANPRPSPTPTPVTGFKFDLKGPCVPSGPLAPINEGCHTISQLVIPVGPTAIKPNLPLSGPIMPEPTNGPSAQIFTVQPLGQTGRPIVITGPFDGDAGNTGVTITPGDSTPLTGGTPPVGCTVLTESPRGMVVQMPPGVTGPAQMNITELGLTSTAPIRIVKLDLTAPKTNLMRGEKTTIGVSVTGLQGLNTPVTISLQCSGPVTMSGGNTQQFVVKPNQVAKDGTYQTTRNITGVQAGSWGAIASVVTPMPEPPRSKSN